MSAIEPYAPTTLMDRFRQALKPLSMRRLVRLLRQRARRARTLSDLSRLDDRLLYDLGIDPLDLHEAISQRRNPFGLARLARHRLDKS